jgi:hypothetical protein
VGSVTILRALWRRRIEVSLVALLAIGAGWAVCYRLSLPPQPRGYSVGVANASLLVDTPKSQVVEVAPRGSDALASRAGVLASLMVDGEIKNAIAQRVGLPPKQLIASSSGIAGPVTPLNARSYAYTTSVALTSDMATLPIIRVQAQAPDVQQAIKLANAVVGGLGQYLDSKATDEAISDTRRLRVRALGTAQGEEAARGPGRLMALAVAFVVFMAGCATVLAVSGVVRGWRAAAASEQGNIEPGATPRISPEDEVAERGDWPVRERSAATKLRTW